MKQIIVIFLLISMLVLTACGPTPEPDKPDEQPKVVIFEDAVKSEFPRHPMAY